MPRSSTTFKLGDHPSPETEFKKKHVPWNKGLKGTISPEQQERMRLGRIGKPHLWARRRITKVCSRCGKEFETGGRAGSRNQVYCSRHCASMKQNGRSMHTAGYRLIWRDGRRILEHRIIAEQVLGRPLTRQEVVHHVNGDKLDNCPENLMVMTQAQHRALIDYLATLWVKEHPREARQTIQTFLSS